MSEDIRRGEAFRYVGFELEPTGASTARLTCSYELDGEAVAEMRDLRGGAAAALPAHDVPAYDPPAYDTPVYDVPAYYTPNYDSEAARAAARLVWLLAGVSYYKARAPRRIVVDGGLTGVERQFLREFYLHGLAEFAHVTGVDVHDLRIEADVVERRPAAAATAPGRPLVPFGGGIDSIVVVDDTVRQHPDTALFVANTSDVLFEPIEQTAASTGLPVLRARRHLDPAILRSRERGYLNGHVPVTGVLSAVAVLVAVAHGRDQVVMSNEHSASEPTSLVANGVPVNHQWSKGIEFETRFRELVAATVTGVDYHSALRR